MVDAERRDSTQDWLLPESARPPSVRELQAGIEEALATARASERAVMTVGAAALDAAEQARRAADLAERASAAALEGRPTATAPAPVPAAAQPPPGPDSAGRAPGFARPAPAVAGEGDELRDFSARADRLAARLRELERVPLATAG